MNNYKLIDGEFSPEEAKKILLSILNSKIDFHNLYAFSNHIRFDNDLNISKKRIGELNVTKEDIIELIEKGIQDGHNFRIKSSIDIELI